MEAVWKEATADSSAIQPGVDPLLWTLGRRLKMLRGEAKLSQLELATAAGMRKQFLNRVENGRQNVSTKTLWRLAEALGTPMASLFVNVARAVPARQRDEAPGFRSIMMTEPVMPRPPSTPR